MSQVQSSSIPNSLFAQKWLLFALAVFVPVGAAAAQQPGYPTPLLRSIFPLAGKAGDTVEVTLDGVDLSDASDIYFSVPKLKAVRIPDPKPDPKKKNNASLPPRFRVTIPADAPVGICDVRAIGKWGISNPRAFVVSDLTEIAEKEDNNDVLEAQRVELGTGVSGTIAGKTDVDYFSFAGNRGQRVIVHCGASSIDSRLTPYLQLFDPLGRERASNRHYRDRDALLDYTLADDGEYLIRVCDFAYLNGGSECGYRLSISTNPWIDAAFPPVVVPGKPAQVTLYGRNLPSGKASDIPSGSAGVFEQLPVTINAPAPGSLPAFPGRLMPRIGTVDGFGYRLARSNAVFLSIADGPLVLDQGNNDDLANAQLASVPCDICGRIDKRNDRDYYVFEAKKDEVIIVEGFADRLRSSFDLVLQLRRLDNGQVIGEFDSHAGVPSVIDRFYTHTNDPLARLVAPVDGRYELLVRSRDAQVQFGPREVYRVNLRREREDFHLVVVSNHDSGAGFTLRRGASHDVRVICFRQDNFEDDVAISVEGLPNGVTCEPQTLGPKQREGSLVLSAAADAADFAGEIKITGVATVNGKKVVRQGQAGVLVFPTANNNVPAVSRLARSVCLAVRDRGPFALSAPTRKIFVPVGGTANVKIKALKQNPLFKDKVQVDIASGPVEANGNRVKLAKVSIDADKDIEVKLQVPGNATPGTYYLVLRGTGKINLEDPATKQKRNSQFSAVTPPVQVIVFDTPCDLALGQPKLALRPGDQAVLPVSVTRLHDFADELKLELVVPNGVSGISAASLTIPATAKDGKLIIKADKNAKPVKEVKFIVRALAKFGNVTLKKETSVPITIDPLVAKSDTNFKAVVLLPDGADGWTYTASVSGDNWRTPAFADKEWKSGKAPLGYGEEQIATKKGTTVGFKGAMWCRRSFDVPDDLHKQKGVAFRLLVASDNSAAVYLNGKLIDQDPVADHEFSYWNRDVTIPVDALVAGRNVIAVQMANPDSSSDLYFDLSVAAEVPMPAKK